VRGRDLHGTERACQSLGGHRLDRAVAEAFLAAVSPAGVTASAGAVAELEREHDERLAQQRLALERAEYEAERARRQYDACEPEHRLVARTLERAWEQALAEAERERGKLAALERTRPAPPTDEDRVALVRLARDLPRLWAAETTSDRDRKELLRTLVRETIVTVRTREAYAEVELVWEGGARSELRVPLARRGPERHRTSEQVNALGRAAMRPRSSRAASWPWVRREGLVGVAAGSTA
jgi:hypothetical protein